MATVEPTSDATRRHNSLEAKFLAWRTGALCVENLLLVAGAFMAFVGGANRHDGAALGSSIVASTCILCSTYLRVQKKNREEI